VINIVPHSGSAFDVAAMKYQILDRYHNVLIQEYCRGANRTQCQYQYVFSI